MELILELGLLLAMLCYIQFCIAAKTQPTKIMNAAFLNFKIRNDVDDFLAAIASFASAQVMICSLSWVPCGAMKIQPLKFDDKIVFSNQESSSNEEAKASQKALLAAKSLNMLEPKDEIDPTSAEDHNEDTQIDSKYGLPVFLKMDKYDESDEEFDSDAELPENLQKMQNSDSVDNQSDNDIDSDEEDDLIKPDDAVLISAVTDEEGDSELLIYVYDMMADSFYVHHDVPLNAIILAVEWMNLRPSPCTYGAAPQGSFAAVGCFEPNIDIWNMDVLLPAAPEASLGGWKNEEKKEVKPGSHEDAVICLSWNEKQRQVIASGGADSTVKLWDVTIQSCSVTMTHHSDKVQCVKWHPTEISVMASISYDKSMSVLDARSPSAAKSITLGEEPECLQWNPHSGSLIFVGTSTGNVRCWDVRKLNEKPLHQFRAHESSVSALSFSPHFNGFMATCGTDRLVSLWDVSNSTGQQQLSSKSMQAGKLIALQFHPDCKYLLATGGSKMKVALWHTDDEESVRRLFV